MHVLIGCVRVLVDHGKERLQLGDIAVFPPCGIPQSAMFNK